MKPYGDIPKNRRAGTTMRTISKSVTKFLTISLLGLLLCESATAAGIHHYRMRAKLPWDSLGQGLVFNPNAPRITGLSDITYHVGDSVTPITFTLQDADTPTTALVVSASSGNTGLFPNNAAHITLS